MKGHGTGRSQICFWAKIQSEVAETALLLLLLNDQKPLSAFFL